MLTPAQRSKFFRLARAAHIAAAPGAPFNAWRHAEMMKACGEDSVFTIDPVWGYDALMGHFAVLACDYSACAYFADAAERRVRWVLDGMVKDLEFLQMRGVAESYCEAIYRQANMLPRDFGDATLRDLLTLIPMLDTHIRKLAGDFGFDLQDLPTAGFPWKFRGISAARFRAFVDNLRARDGSTPKTTATRQEILTA